MIDSKELEQLKKELRLEIKNEYEAKLEQMRVAFNAALTDKNLIIEKCSDPYEGPAPKLVKRIKIIIQFLIGISLITTLSVKGIFELIQTTNPNIGDLVPHINHLLKLNIYKYIGNALGISAGIELGYMLFTDGPDETIEPLMMAIAAGAFYCVSEAPEKHSTAILIYAISLLVLILCVPLYNKLFRHSVIN